MINICISFDYELFFGKNYYNEEITLFQPTDRILELLDKEQVKGTFFADVCSVTQNKKYEKYEYVSCFEQQVKKAKQNGNDIQLHIHPNWLNTSLNGAQWDFDIDSYRIHTFGFDDGENSAKTIIKNGKTYLEGLLREVDSNYKCIAYRAGGYSIQPHDELFAALRENGILIDSSVCRHVKATTEANWYNFRRLPNNINWWIVPNMDFCYMGRADQGGLYEVPLCSKKNNILEKLIMPADKLVLKNAEPKGTFIPLYKNATPLKKVTLIKKIIDYQSSYALVSFDSMPWQRMVKKLDGLRKKYNTDNKDIFISIICHPKLFDDAIRDNMKSFIRFVKENSENYRFMTFTDVYDEIQRGGI